MCFIHTDEVWSLVIVVNDWIWAADAAQVSD